MKKVMFVMAMVSLGTLCWAGSAREDATARLYKSLQRYARNYGDA